MPFFVDIKYLCKLIPTPFDLIFRRFVPFRELKQKIQERFELRFTGYNRIMNVPYLSGCFMFFSIRALNDVGLFDERFFMYPEDIDITRRMHERYKTIFLPEVTVYHNHAKESYQSLKMLWVHVKNMILYFNKWGWFFDNTRKEINLKILKDQKWKK